MKRMVVRPCGHRWQYGWESGWLTFWRDLTGYGPGVALHNVFWLWVHRRDRHVRTW